MVLLAKAQTSVHQAPRAVFAMLAAVCWLLLAFPACSGRAGPAEHAQRAQAPPAQRHSQAYATLLYSDEFLLGARCLGQSIREAGTHRDLVVLATHDVSESAAATLAADGWRMKRVDRVPNPGTWTQDAVQRFPARFGGVYTKLLLWNLTEYERVVYLDADTVVVSNADELFTCDGLCGVLRHSERINTGVLVLTPSTRLLHTMLAAVDNTTSYTGGDQGFLNAFFGDWAAAPLFDPRQGRLLSEASTWRTAANGTQDLPLGRLPTGYNADLGLFIANSGRWTLPPADIRVLHYTLAAFKPWDWWSGWIMGETAARWQALRSRLPPPPAGAAAGLLTQVSGSATLLVLPLLLAALLVRHYLWQQGLGASMRVHSRRAWRAAACCARGVLPSSPRGTTPPSSGSSSPPHLLSKAQQQQQLDASAVAGASAASTLAWLATAAAAASVASLLVSVYCALALVPRQVSPAIGWPLAYEWTAVSFLLAFSRFLHLSFLFGRASVGGAGGAGVEPPLRLALGLARPWGITVALLAAVLATLGLIPWWADLLSVKSFVGRVLTTVVLGALSAIACVQACVALTAKWYTCGAREAAVLRGAASRPAA